MASLRALLGMFPETSDIEEKRTALIEEFNEFNKFSESDELKEYLDLKKRVTSPEFAVRKKQIQKQKFKDTDEYKKEREYTHLINTKDIKLYYKTKDSLQLKDFELLHSSSELKYFYELEEYLKSPEFRRVKSFMKMSQRKRERQTVKPTEAAYYNETEAYQKEQEYKDLKVSESFKSYFKFKKSKEFANYKRHEGSERITYLEELEKFLKSEKFLNVKEYMALSPARKYELSEEYKEEQEYLKLKESEKIKWYYKVSGSKKFDELKKWEVTFEDDFTKKELDQSKWITRYFWGETLLQESYSLPGDKHFYTDGKNLVISDSILKIITRKENKSGKSWNPKIGFFPKEFNYTSGLISSGNSFRQKYGIFEAKIRFSSMHPVRHAFWMLSDHIMPHIDVMKTDKKLMFNYFWGDIKSKRGIKKKMSGLKSDRFVDKFFIYTLEWNRKKIRWKINGVTVATLSEHIPHDPMYVNLCSGITAEVNGKTLPTEMEIDWVRCYQKTEN
ncbi:MAG: family 16 glycosylhydrolase [Bacteroidales bacterium]|nr:family 16 glycosylhydrolase [Bacteroidales bacterium]